MMIFLFCLLNLISLGLVILTFRIEAGRLRIALQMLLLAFLVWSDGLLLLFQPWFPDVWLAYVARGMFAGATATLILFAVFVALFCNHQDLFRKPVFLLVELIALIFFVLCFTDGIVKRAEVTSSGFLRLHYGFLQPMFVIFFWAAGVWLHTIIFRAGTSAQNEMEKVQLRYLFATSSISFFGIVISNGIVPILLGHSNWSFVGAILITCFYSGILYLILRGDILFAQRAFHKLLVSPEIRLERDNIQALRRVIGTLDLLAKDRPIALEREFTLLLSPRKTPLSFRINAGRLQMYRARNLLSTGFVEGHLDRLNRLERENAEMFLAIAAMQRAPRTPEGSPRMVADTSSHDLLAEDEDHLSPLERAERRTILDYLNRNRFNQAQTSRDIGIRQNTLIAKMKKYGIHPPAGINRRGRKPKE